MASFYYNQVKATKLIRMLGIDRGGDVFIFNVNMNASLETIKSSNGIIIVVDRISPKR